jgi:hypothetical protein
LRVVNAGTQAVMNGVCVGSKSIRGELEIACCSLVQFFDENVCVSGRAASKMPRENQLCVAFDSDKAIGVSAFRVAHEVPFLFTADKAPQFIALDFGHRNGADFAFEDAFALFSDHHKQRQNRGVMYSGHAFDGVDRASFNKKLDNFQGFVQRGIHAAERSVVLFRESLTALTAAIASKSVAMFPKLLTFGVAIVAGHGLFPLAFLREKPNTQRLGSECGLCSRLDSALPPAQTGGRVFSLPPTKPERPSSVTPQNFALLPKPLENRIKKRQRILDAREVVAPIGEGIPNFDRTQRPTSRLIYDSPHKIGPRDFCLYLLPKSGLEADFGGLQLCDFYVQLVALARFHFDFCPYFPESVLESACHGYS